MKTLTKNKRRIRKAAAPTWPKVKIGISRQVAIPKMLYDALNLMPGDYLEMELRDERLVLTPKTFIEKRLAEGLQDIREGRVIGPFRNAKVALKALGI